MVSIQKNPKGLVFSVFVQPRSSKNMIVGAHGDALKIKLTAPPVEGEANKMCISVLAKSLKIPKSSLEILSGHTSRSKRVLLKYSGKPSKDEQRRLRWLIQSLVQKTP